MIGLQMLLDRGERMEWFNSAEIWAEAIASVLGFYLFLVHVLTMKAHFLDKALFKDRNFVLSAIMYFAFGFVLLPTIALTSPMLDEMLNYPADTTGYMAIPRSIALVGALILTGRSFRRGSTIGCSWPVEWRSSSTPIGGCSAIHPRWTGGPLSWRAWSKAPAWASCCRRSPRRRSARSIRQFRPEGTALFNLSRLYGSTIGIALVLFFFYDNTQAMHVALAKDLTPYRAAAHVAGSIAKPGLAALNDMITGQAAFVGVIDQFEVMMIAMLIVSPLVLFLRKPRPANQQGG